MPHSITIRQMTDADLPAVGKLAGTLVRLHHLWDQQRFMIMEGIEEGYARYFKSQLGDEKVLLRVAMRGELLAGYLYGTLEERNWNLLLDPHGAVHDVCVENTSRESGVATALLNDAISFFQSKKMPRVVLMTSTENVPGRKLFGKLGFRETMVEMTKELKT